MSMTEKIVDGIIADLSDRRGLRHEWEAIDLPIRDEIRDRWIGIAEAAIQGACTGQQAMPEPSAEEQRAEWRRRYAGVALEGLLAGTSKADDDEPALFETPAALAKEAVEYADALLAALAAPEGK